MEEKDETVSLVDQVVEKMLKEVKETVYFNDEIINILKEVHKAGDLKKQNKIINAIKPKLEE